VTFDIDANGILNVKAEDKSSGKAANITITNDAGRLSKAEIDRMLSDASKYADDDRDARERVEAKNALENYAFQMRNTVTDEKVAAKVDAADREKVKDECTKVLQWLEASQAASKEEYETRQKELEALCTPIVTKLYQQGGAGPEGGAGGFPGGGVGGGGGKSGPSVEEVD